MPFADLPSITMVQVLPDDAHLATSLPDLGRIQATAHDTRLPDLPVHRVQIVQNFTRALAHVEIWRLEQPAAGGAAIFLSPLHRAEGHGLQLDDIVVHPEWRGQGIGSSMIAFAAFLAKQRGLSFLAWECEENNPAQKMYRAVGAEVRAGLKPFRLNAALIKKIREDYSPVQSGASCAVSDRFSLFRTLNFGIDGYDMDPREASCGLQIEDLRFDDEAAAQLLLSSVFTARPDISFADLVVPVQDQKYADLIKNMEIAQNTYSGNPAMLWLLAGQAFADAARYGQELKTA